MYYLNDEDLRFVEDAAKVTVDPECAIDLLDYDELEEFCMDIKLSRVSQSQKVKLAKLLNSRFDLSIKVVGQSKEKADRALIDAMFALHTRLGDDAIENGEINDDEDDDDIATTIAIDEKYQEITDQEQYTPTWAGDIDPNENPYYDQRLMLQTVITETETEVVVEQVTVNDEWILVTSDWKYEVIKTPKQIKFYNHLGDLVNVIEYDERFAQYVNVKTRKERVKRSEFVAKNTPKPEPKKVVIPTAEEFILNAEDEGTGEIEVIGYSGDEIAYRDICRNTISTVNTMGCTQKLCDYNEWTLAGVKAKYSKMPNMAKFLGIKSAKSSSNTPRVAANGPRSGYPTADKPSSQRFLTLALEATAKNGHFTLESDVMPQTGWAYSNARNYLSYVQSWAGYTLEKLGNKKYRLTSKN